MRLLQAGLVMVLLASTAIALSSPGPVDDPVNDQTATGDLQTLETAGSDCRDGATDVTFADVHLTEAWLEIHIQVQDAAAQVRCGAGLTAVDFTTVNRYGVVDMYFGPWGMDGLHIAWTHDAEGKTKCLAFRWSQYEPMHCRPSGAPDRPRSGNTISWALPRSGMTEGPDGRPFQYELREDFGFEGRMVTEASSDPGLAGLLGGGGQLRGTLEDWYGWPGR